MENKPKQIWILLGAAVIVLVIVVVAVMSGKKGGPLGSSTPSVEEGVVSVNDENIPAGSEQVNPGTATQTQAVVAKTIDLTEAKAVVPGGNLITKDNIVATPEGKVAVNNSRPMAIDAPKQTGLLDKAALPSSVVKLDVTNQAFTPASFTVKAGAPISLAVTSADTYTHVLAFDDPSLSAIAVLVGMSQTKAITFNAPTVPGTYTFRDDAPDHAGRGKMIVVK